MGDLKKGESLTLALSLATNGEVKASVRADVSSSSGEDQPISYYLSVNSVEPTNKDVVENDFVRTSSRQITNAQALEQSTVDSSRAIIEPPTAPNAQASDTITIEGTWWFVNEDGGYSPMQHVRVWLRDDDNFGDEWVASTWTDGSGFYSITADNDDGFLQGGRDPYIEVYAEGAWDWYCNNGDGGGTYYSYTGVCGEDVSGGFYYNYGVLVPTSYNEAWQAGQAVYLEAQWIFDRTGWSRSRVEIQWPEGDWPASSGNTIYLADKSVWAWNHVTVQHEEGHCVMYALYGGFPSGGGPSPHYVFSESSGGFAMCEGWAEFMAAAVDNNPSNLVGSYNGHGGNIETNDFFNCIDTGDMDGDIVEGSVASIFWDINDPENIAGDNDHMNWGFDDMFIVLQNDKPQNMLEFWDDWTGRWPDLASSVGPMCDTYYRYGIDKDWYAPWGSIIINGGAATTASRTVTLTLNGDDWGVGVKYMRFSEDSGVTWGSWYNYATTFSYTLTSPGDGYKYVDVQYGDFWWDSAAGTIYDGIRLDTTPPSGTIKINSDASYTTSRTVTLTLNSSDANQMRFSENMGTWGSWLPYSTTHTYSLTSANDGYKMVDVQFKDAAGNPTTEWAIWDGITLDTTPSNGSIVIGSGNPTYTQTTSVTLYLTYSDSGSGVYQVHYGNTGEAWSAWEAPSATKAWTLPTGDGIKYVWYQIKDNAGLISNQFSDGIILDTTAPTGSIIINGGAAITTTTSVTLTLTYNDATSGVYQVRYGNSGGSWSAWQAPSATKTWTIPSGSGIKTVWYQIKDNAGLISTQYSDSINLTSTLDLKEFTKWYWTSNTVINSVASGDVDKDGFKEIVTGGSFFDGTRTVAQLIVWNGSNLAVDRLMTWYWAGNTTINSLALGDVDGDNQTEIVTGGSFFDGTRTVAQLIVWNGSNLAVDRLMTWYWTGNTAINSVAIGNVDGDGQVEIVTGGSFFDGTRNVAQLIEWNGANLAVDRLATWYWTGNTVINSVALGDVDNDAVVEVVTGGYYNDGVRNIAQLIEWNGANLAVDRLTTWYWTGNTVINSVAIGNVDGDSQVEVVTGGYLQ